MIVHDLHECAHPELTQIGDLFASCGMSVGERVVQRYSRESLNLITKRKFLEYLKVPRKISPPFIPHKPFPLIRIALAPNCRYIRAHTVELSVMTMGRCEMTDYSSFLNG